MTFSQTLPDDAGAEIARINLETANQLRREFCCPACKANKTPD